MSHRDCFLCPPCSLNEVLEYAEDMEIDIPKVWDYLGEILAPALSKPPLPFHTLAHVPPPLVKVGKAAELAAKTLLRVKSQQSEAAALSLWTQSQLEWTSLGVKSEDIEEFVSRQVCGCEEGVGEWMWGECGYEKGVWRVGEDRG